MSLMDDYIKRKYSVKESISLEGWVKILCNDKVIFDDHNLVVTEGKGWVMDLLTSLALSYDYTPHPFNAIVLTKNQSAESASDTFANSVFTSGSNLISNEGVLHIGGQVAFTHAKGALSFIATGTLSNSFGNDPANNQINSVCLCAGTNANYGGPGQGAYQATGNERLFSRVNVGSLVKLSSKSYSFIWTVTIS